MGLRVGDTLRVLIVDGDTQSRVLTTGALGATSFLEVVAEASDGVAGVRLAIELDPDLVVYDPASSGGDGNAVVHELMASAPNTAVIIYSESEAGEDGPRDAVTPVYVRKGEPVSELVKALESLAVRRSGRPDPSFLSEISEIQRLAFESMNEGVVVQDQAGRIVFANAAAQRILKSTTGELMGSTSMDPQWSAVHPDGLPWPGKEHPATEALRTQAPVRDVLMGVRTNGDDRCWMSVTATPLRSERGTPMGVVITFVDVTEHQLTSQGLVSSDDGLRSAVDHILDGFIILKAVYHNEEIVDFVCEYVNAAAETNAGYRPEQLIGKRMLEVVPDLAVNDAFTHYIEAIKSGNPIAIEVPWLSGQRALESFEVRGTRVGDRLALTFRNITEQKLTEPSMSAQESRATRNPEEQPDANLARLSPRELEVLTLLEEGATTRDIADRLFLSLNTVRNHIQRSIAKLGAHSRLEAVAIARQSGLLPRSYY